MATVVTQNFFFTGERAMPEPAGSELVAVRCTAQLTGGIVAADVIPIAKIPVGAVVVDYILDNPDLDTNGAPTVAFNLGVLNAAGAISALPADGGVWRTGATAFQAAAVTRASAASAAEQMALLRMAPAATERTVAILATANAATAHVGTAEVGLTLVYRAANGAN